MSMIRKKPYNYYVEKKAWLVRDKIGKMARFIVFHRSHAEWYSQRNANDIEAVPIFIKYKKPHHETR